MVYGKSIASIPSEDVIPGMVWDIQRHGELNMEMGNNQTSTELTWPADEDVVRAFFAIQLDALTRGTLARAQETMRRLGAKVSWVAPENLHLTMAFLGDTFGATLRKLAEALAPLVVPVTPFELRIEGLGAFGPPGRPRVLWAGIASPPEPLFELQRQVAGAAQKAGIVLENRPFSAHITLGRVRPAVRVPEALTSHLACHINSPFGRLGVGELHLMRSRLGPQGPVYRVMRAFSLGSAAGGAAEPDSRMYREPKE